MPVIASYEPEPGDQAALCDACVNQDADLLEPDYATIRVQDAEPDYATIRVKYHEEDQTEWLTCLPHLNDVLIDMLDDQIQQVQAMETTIENLRAVEKLRAPRRSAAFQGAQIDRGIVALEKIGEYLHDICMNQQKDRQPEIDAHGAAVHPRPDLMVLPFIRDLT